MKVYIDAAAKINLMLDILGRRENGYHDVFMVMQSVSVFDTVAVTRVPAGIRLKCSEPSLPIDNRNLAWRAAEAFFAYTGITGGAEIEIEKRIPFAAGLAGGSADAAATLVGLDAVYETALSRDELCAIGVTLGADVPFCIQGGARIAEGIGEKLEYLRPLMPCYLVLAKPDCSVSTAEAYAKYDTRGWRREPDKKGIIRAMKLKQFSEVGRLLGNVFEQLIEVPERPRIKDAMRRHGAAGACMSGTGPTVFGLFAEKADAEAAAAEIRRFCPEVFVCEPVSFGCKRKKMEKIV